MITFNDIERVVIETLCHDSCTHSARVTFKDGTTKAILPKLIQAIIMHVAEERINPNLKWKGEEVKRHFKTTEEWSEEASLKILNTIFLEK